MGRSLCARWCATNNKFAYATKTDYRGDVSVDGGRGPYQGGESSPITRRTRCHGTVAFASESSTISSELVDGSQDERLSVSGTW